MTTLSFGIPSKDACIMYFAYSERDECSLFRSSDSRDGTCTHGGERGDLSYCSVLDRLSRSPKASQLGTMAVHIH